MNDVEMSSQNFLFDVRVEWEDGSIATNAVSLASLRSNIIMKIRPEEKRAYQRLLLDNALSRTTISDPESKSTEVRSFKEIIISRRRVK